MKLDWFLRLRLALFGGVVMLLLGGEGSTASAADSTHKQAWSIQPKIDGQIAQLNTYCADASGSLWMCCSDSQGAGYLVVSDPKGEVLKTVSLSFVPQAINFAPAGEIYVAGSGKVAKLSPQGEVLLEVDAPNLQNPDATLATLKEKLTEMVDEMIQQSADQLKLMDESIEKLSVAPESETDREKKRRELRLKALTDQRASAAESIEQTRESYLQSYMSMATVDRLKTATGIAVTKQDVYVSLPSAEGFGYAIWRMSHDLTDGKEVIPSVSGCCGQLDIQSDGENLVLAANTQFQVVRYNRDGQQLSAFGERNRGSDSGFGSCCNPMNVRCCDNGEILTAESSIGHIKRFSADGEYLGKVGTAKIGGGCKHVAVSYDSSRNYYYMMNISKGNIAVLIPSDQVTGETDYERDARIAAEGLGQKLLGTWKMVPQNPAAEAAQVAGDDYYSQFLSTEFGVLHFKTDGELQNSKPSLTNESANQSANSTGFLQAIATVFVGDSNADAEQAGASNSLSLYKWRAVRQTEDSLDVVFISDDVEAYAFRAKFADDNTIVCDWYYGDPAEGSLLNYQSQYERSVSTKCESGQCESGQCAEGNCACEKETSAEKSADIEVVK